MKKEINLLKERAILLLTAVYMKQRPENARILKLFQDFGLAWKVQTCYDILDYL